MPGARVTVYPNRGCGECLWCKEGKRRYCLDPPEHYGGGFAEFAPGALLGPTRSVADIAGNLARFAVAPGVAGEFASRRWHVGVGGV